MMAILGEKLKSGRPPTSSAARKAFSSRLNAACDANLTVPPLHYCRNTWIRDRLGEKHNIHVTSESVRKGLDGQTIPSDDRKVALSGILGVDYQWLTFGTGGHGPVRSHDNPNMISMSPPVSEPQRDVEFGKHIAIVFVKTGGGRVEEIYDRSVVHFTATVRGAKYSIHGVLGEPDGQGGWTLFVPTDAEDTFILCVIPIGPARFKMIDLDWESTSSFGERRIVEKRMGNPTISTRSSPSSATNKYQAESTD
jgi:hypothetical protein